ncbi:hypothetical protein STEG23_005861, partial [Scotinomys teguina]
HCGESHKHVWNHTYLLWSTAKGTEVTPEDLSRFVVELQQRELALKEKNNIVTSSSQIPSIMFMDGAVRACLYILGTFDRDLITVSGACPPHCASLASCPGRQIMSLLVLWEVVPGVVGDRGRGLRCPSGSLHQCEWTLAEQLSQLVSGGLSPYVHHGSPHCAFQFSVSVSLSPGVSPCHTLCLLVSRYPEHTQKCVTVVTPISIKLTRWTITLQLLVVMGEKRQKTVAFGPGSCREDTSRIVTCAPFLTLDTGMDLEVSAADCARHHAQRPGRASIQFFWCRHSGFTEVTQRVRSVVTHSQSLSARCLEKAQQQLQDEVRQVTVQLLEERKKRETHEALARRLQKRNVLLTKTSGKLHVLACAPLLTSPAALTLLYSKHFTDAAISIALDWALWTGHSGLGTLDWALWTGHSGLGTLDGVALGGRFLPVSSAVGDQGLLQSSVTPMRCHLTVHDRTVSLPFQPSPNDFQPQSIFGENTKQIAVVEHLTGYQSYPHNGPQRLGKPERLLERVLAGRVVLWIHSGVKDPGEQGSGVAGDG